MCINEKVSLSVFILCTVTCTYLYKRNNRNDKWIAVLFIYLGSMQFLEYLMWKDQECKGLNQFATNIGFWHNILQPVVSLAIAYYFTDGNLPNWIYMIFIVYIIYSFPKIWKSKKDNQCSKPCGSDTVGLSWEYTNTNNSTIVWGIFCLALSAPLFAMEQWIYGILVIFTYILSYFISIYRCPNYKIPPNGSWWCFMAGFIPLLALKINN